MGKIIFNSKYFKILNLNKMLLYLIYINKVNLVALLINLNSV